MIRRQAILGTMMAAAIGMTMPVAASAADAVSLRLNWLIYGFHSPFYLGVERGYYADEGIDLTINEGQGSGKAVQIVAAGGDTFGVSDSGSVMAGVAKGAPIKAVFAMTNGSPYAVGIRPDRKYDSPADLKGMTIAATAGEAGVQLWPGVLAANGLSSDDVSFLMVDGPGKMVAVLEDKVDGLMAGLDNQCLILPARGLDIKCVSFADLGVDTVGLTVHTTTGLLDSNPDLVRRFVRATVKSFEAAVADPVASVEAGMKSKPDSDKDLWLQQIKAGIAIMDTPATKDLPLGTFALSDWQRTLDLMKTYRGLETDLPAEAFFTNELVAR